MVSKGNGGKGIDRIKEMKNVIMYNIMYEIGPLKYTNNQTLSNGLVRVREVGAPYSSFGGPSKEVLKNDLGYISFTHIYTTVLLARLYKHPYDAFQNLVKNKKQNKQTNQKTKTNKQTKKKQKKHGDIGTKC